MDGLVRTFLGLPQPVEKPEDARVVVVPVPYDAATSAFGGARHGPGAIIQATVELEEYDVELGLKPADVGIFLDEPVEPHLGSPDQMAGFVQRACEKWHRQGKFVLALGGDHSVAVGAARAAAGRFPSLSFLQIDAHLDLRDSYQGTRLSHACTARRIWELGPLVSVGIRSGAAEEVDWLKKNEVEVFWAYRIADDPSMGWIDQVVERLGSEVYVTFDVDGLDPSIMPATGTPEPGGLHYRQVLRLFDAVSRRRKVVSCDLCELAPIPSLHSPNLTAAKLAYKMIGYFVARDFGER